MLALSRMHGHTSAEVTLDTYSDLFDTDLDSVADALDLKCAHCVRIARPAAAALALEKLPTCVNRRGAVAVAEGFEPSDGGYPSHAFEACSLGRSDTPPCGSLPNA